MNMNMSKKKMYVSPGLTELHLIVGTSAAPVSVEFTGGSTSGYGTRPAHFATDDPVLQRLIESSQPFRKGIIVISR